MNFLSHSLWTHADACVKLFATEAAAKMRNARNTIPTSHHRVFSNTLLVQLALVEGELLALQDVAVAAARLARAAGDNGEQTTGLELLLDGALNLALLGETGTLLLLNGLALLLLLDVFALLSGLGLLASAADALTVVGLVPLAEGGGVDLNDGALGQGVGADQLVVRRVVSDTDDTALASAALGGPGKVTGVETEGTVLVVAAAGADSVNALGANTGVGTLATSLESALLPVVGSLGARGGALVARVARDTHDCEF
jgi:hypothetical protein